MYLVLIGPQPSPVTLMWTCSVALVCADPPAMAVPASANTRATVKTATLRCIVSLPTGGSFRHGLILSLRQSGDRFVWANIHLFRTC